MRAIVPAIALLMALGACGQGRDAEQTAKPQALAPTPPAPPVAKASAEAVAGSARKITVSNNFYEFDYAYPAAAGAIPALKALLDADAEKQQARIAADARAGRKDAEAAGFNFNPYTLGWAWDVVANIPGWLSLSGAVGSYEGGAHPNHGYEALLWDKAANRRVAPADLFTSKAALVQAISAPFCKELNRQRAEKRGEPVDADSGNSFSECIDPTESAVLLGSADRQHFTRIGVLIGPYEAGPYVEGDYEVTLPVTAAVLQAVKPEYRRFFAVQR